MVKKYLLQKLYQHLIVAMQSRETKIGLLLEDAQTVLEQGVKSGTVKMDMQLEIRYFNSMHSFVGAFIF